MMRPSRRLQQGPPAGREAEQRGKRSSLGVGGKQSGHGRELRGRSTSKGAVSTAREHLKSSSPSSLSSESSPEPSPSRKARKVVAASSPSSHATKAKGAATKGHSPPTPLSTPNKKPKMQLPSDVTPTSEVSFLCMHLFFYVPGLWAFLSRCVVHFRVLSCCLLGYSHAFRVSRATLGAAGYLAQVG